MGWVGHNSRPFFCLFHPEYPSSTLSSQAKPISVNYSTPPRPHFFFSFFPLLSPVAPLNRPSTSTSSPLDTSRNHLRLPFFLHQHILAVFRDGQFTSSTAQYRLGTAASQWRPKDTLPATAVSESGRGKYVYP